jgi:predicted nucleotidyltransferase
VNFEPLKQIVEPISEVWALYLFGSQAKGTATNSSDVDLALMLDPRVKADVVWNLRLDVASKFEQLLGRDIDLVVLGADLDLTFRVLREGSRLFTRDHDEVCSREATLASMYYDFKPFLDSYYENVAKRFRRVG